jgi:hypothetical protein
MESSTEPSSSDQPYGDVVYADLGCKEDGKKPYPLESERYVPAAWSYIHRADDRESCYTADRL